MSRRNTGFRVSHSISYGSQVINTRRQFVRCLHASFMKGGLIYSRVSLGLSCRVSLGFRDYLPSFPPSFPPSFLPCVDARRCVHLIPYLQHYWCTGQGTVLLFSAELPRTSRVFSGSPARQRHSAALYSSGHLGRGINIIRGREPIRVSDQRSLVDPGHSGGKKQGD